MKNLFAQFLNFFLFELSSILEILFENDMLVVSLCRVFLSFFVLCALHYMFEDKHDIKCGDVMIPYFHAHFEHFLGLG